MGVWAELASVDVLGITGEGENEGCREAVVTGLIRRAFGQNLYSHPVISSLKRNQEKLTLSHSMMHLINVSISLDAGAKLWQKSSESISGPPTHALRFWRAESPKLLQMKRVRVQPPRLLHFQRPA